MPSPRAVLFDLDDTLLDGNSFAQSIVRTCEQLAGAVPGLDAARIVEANAAAFAEYWPEISTKWATGILSGEDVTRETWRRTLRACGCVDEGIVQLAFEIHDRLARESYRLFDDAPAVLAALRQAHIPLGLVTNGAPDTQRDKLRALGIENVFAVTVVSGEVGVAKPDPRVFAHAFDGLKIGGEGVWHVGDNLSADIAGANAAGITSVWINRHGVSLKEDDP